jgi:hypothetical protein
MAARLLCVFDFDHTLIDVNSDTHVVKVVNPRVYTRMVALRAQWQHELEAEAREQGQPPTGFAKRWTALMDWAMR